MGDSTNTDNTSYIGKADRDEVLLAGYPGAAVIVSLTGEVLRANPKGAGLETLITHGAVPEIKGLVAKAIGVGTVAAGSVSLQSSKGEIIHELTVVPVDSERLQFRAHL